MTAAPDKFSTLPLAELLDGIELGEASAAAVGPDARSTFAKLAELGEHRDALKIAGAALPKREAVWMATRCVRELLGEKSAATQLAALDAAQAWTHDPTDAHRRAAHDASEKAKLDQPAGVVALCAFLSEGSLGPPEIAPIPPPRHLSGVTVGLALELALAVTPPEQAASFGKRCIEIALEVAVKPAPWEVKPEAAAPSASARRSR